MYVEMSYTVYTVVYSTYMAYTCNQQKEPILCNWLRIIHLGSFSNKTFSMKTNLHVSQKLKVIKHITLWVS